MKSLILLELLLLLAGASLFFYLFSPIDLWFSGLFWNGQDFVFTKTGFGSLFTVYLHSGMRIAFFIFAACGWFFMPWRKCLFIILCVGLTAGLITNVILKDHWGRARPVQVSQFGGTATFTPVWVISDQCSRNCSFVGGDASFAFCALAPALLATRRRKLWISAALGFGTMISLGRIAAGAHFLSDCVIAGLVTVLVVTEIHKWMERDHG
jgi:lipid A 4'-phosphatase